LESPLDAAFDCKEDARIFDIVALNFGIVELQFSLIQVELILEKIKKGHLDFAQL